MAAPVVIATGPAKGLVGGQARHLDLLEVVAGRLDCKFVRFEVGRRIGQSGLTGFLLRVLHDYASFAMALRREIRSGVPVVVHINSSVQYASLLRDLGFALLARLSRPASQLVQIHGSELSSAEDRKPLLRAFARLITRVAGRMVVLSVEQSRSIGGPALAASVIANSIEMLHAVDRGAPRQRPLRLLYLARMIPEKGVLVCLDAIGLLRDRGVAAELTFAGDGPLLDSLPALISARGLESRVRLVGPVPSGKVRDLLAAHDLLWAPSCYAEGQPYSLIEALEAGLPALATAVNPAMKEMIGSAKGALISVAASASEVADVTASLAAAPDELNRLQRVARSVAACHYSLEAALPRWRTVWLADHGIRPTRATRRAGSARRSRARFWRHTDIGSEKRALS